MLKELFYVLNCSFHIIEHRKTQLRQEKYTTESAKDSNKTLAKANKCCFWRGLDGKRE